MLLCATGWLTWQTCACWVVRRHLDHADHQQRPSRPANRLPPGRPWVMRRCCCRRRRRCRCQHAGPCVRGVLWLSPRATAARRLSACPGDAHVRSTCDAASATPPQRRDEARRGCGRGCACPGPFRSNALTGALNGMFFDAHAKPEAAWVLRRSAGSQKNTIVVLRYSGHINSEGGSMHVGSATRDTTPARHEPLGHPCCGRQHGTPPSSVGRSDVQSYNIRAYILW